MAGLIFLSRKLLKRKFTYLYNEAVNRRHCAKPRNVSGKFENCKKRNLNNMRLPYFISLFILFSCKTTLLNESNSIHKIRYAEVGGKKAGGDLSIEITKDSTFFKEGNTVFVKEKTSVEFWKKISTSLTVNQLIEAEHGRSRNYVDESDDLYEVETATKKYSFLNRITSKNEKEANNFTKELHTEFSRLWWLYQGTSH